MPRVIGKGGLAISSKMKANAKGCAIEVLTKFDRIVQIWTFNTVPDHNNGQCVDYMITIPRMTRTEQVEYGDRIARYHITNAKRLGVEWIIWNRRIWRAKANIHGPKGWGPYTGPKPHTDHLHVQYNALSYEPPKNPVKPAPDKKDYIMATPKELIEADIIEPPQGHKTPENKTWTLRGYLQKLVENQDIIISQQNEILTRLPKIERLPKVES